MSEVDTQTVRCNGPYIPVDFCYRVFPARDFALRLGTTHRSSPTAVHEPFNVIYQTAEDGLGDTIKPRLMEGKSRP